MNTEFDFNSLWQQQPAAPKPNLAELVGKATVLKSKARRSLILHNLLLLATAVFTSYVWWHYQPQMITTKIGIIFIILSIVTLVVTSSKSLLGIYKSNLSASASQYLQQLIIIKQKQEFLQQTMMSLYFIMLTLGLILYMVEYTMRMSITGAVAAYGITLAWMAFNWFYLRPKAMKKQQRKLNEMIEKFEELASQMK